ncbi:IS481 family transposase [Bradyrhizobium commune]|uniref:IS481 family transposase n=1 Tax=Bradyrhizobium commune TaxID=83627 RepID=A0A7S9D0C5_9BRAD|nr:IS481 family transposase [Bradyrhizobium commune]QPF88856.1 IS481 family transposase [Bradyrhizobium commune]
MPWREVSVMDQRREFVMLAKQEGVNRRKLCRQFGISAQTGYKWIERYDAGDTTLADRSRRPHRSPDRTEAAIEQQIVALRDVHPAWGARKILHRLKRDRQAVPAISTTHEILRRYDRVSEPAGRPGQPYIRFEKEAPNQLWQMDFKGHSPLEDGVSCHPLTMLDDHSRFSLCLAACDNERGSTVQGHLRETFRRYGLPDAMFVDNGGPWGFTLEDPWTGLTVWLLKLGVRVIHSRPYHPQSRGKNERFHRTLKAEVFAFRRYRDLAEVQRAFDQWRAVYNLDRPHEALNYNVPASRYQPSSREMPDRLPAVEYDEHEVVRSVSTTKAYVSFKGKLWKVPQAFRGERLAIRPLNTDGRFGIFFAAHQIAAIDLG